MSSQSVCRLQWLMPWAATSKEADRVQPHHRPQNQLVLIWIGMKSQSVCRLQWLMPWAATSKEVEDGHHTGDKKADPDVEDGLDGHEPTKKEQRKRSHPKVMHLLLGGDLGRVDLGHKLGCGTEQLPQGASRPQLSLTS